MEKLFMKSVAEIYRVSMFGRIWSISKIDILLPVVLILASFLPRSMDMGTFLTADEKTWIVRSYEFVRAFKDLRFNDMLQTTHPGVTTLWVSGLAVTAKMLLSHIPFTTDAIINFIKSAQFPIVFLNAIAVPLMYLFMRRMAGTSLAFIAALLIALDPFIIGYSRVIHVDALLGSFLTLAIISSIIYAQSFQKRWLITSAVFSALALLTKIPAIFIFPFFILAVLLYSGRNILHREYVVARLRDSILWILTIILIVLVIWPALLWVPNPVGNVLAIQRDVAVAATTPHNMVEEYSLKPLHYPAALLIRSNPVIFIGVIAGIIGLCISVIKKKISREVLCIVIYLVGFVVMMTLGAKKGDRYIVPAFFALDILAAYGIVWFAGVIPDLIRYPRLLRLDSRLRGNDALFTLLSVGYLLTVIISYHPYEVSYSNPLFPDNLSQELGWGEGLDQVAAWLNANHPNATVASWYPEELDAYTAGRVLHINAHMQNTVQFVVLYRNMFGREPSHYANDFIDEYYKKQEPVFIVRIHGKEFAWVYEKPTYLNTIGDLNANTIVAQDIVVNNEGVAGVDFLPATHTGRSTEGAYVVEVASSYAGQALFATDIPVRDVKDGIWYSIRFPESLSFHTGDHIFIRIRARGTSDPFASVKYSQVSLRSTPVYISRTGSASDAQPKSGSLAVRLTYHAIDGTIATETQTKLLR